MNPRKPWLGIILYFISTLSFIFLCLMGWQGALGLKAILLLTIAATTFLIGRRHFTENHRQRHTQIAKLLFTVAGIMVLLRHPIDTDLVQIDTNSKTIFTIQNDAKQDQKIEIQVKNKEDLVVTTFPLNVAPKRSTHTHQFTDIPNGTYAFLIANQKVRPAMKMPIYGAIQSYVHQVDGKTFVLFALIAMVIKFIGVLSSAFAWHLLLIGQGIRFPYWQTTVTSFLIGRFIGTFLPSTIGLDLYTLYESGRYSNEWTKAMTAKALEKFIGVTGLFLGMVLTLPFGYSVIEQVTAKLNRPDTAPLLAGAILLVAGGISATVILGLLYPGLVSKFITIFGKILPQKIQQILENFTQAVTAYEGKVGLLLLALFNKFITHFTTAVVYFFTALAIGVTSAQFWPIVFGSNIQILATLLSPTIAGEGAREAFQALLLSEQLGGVAQAVLSGALGFIAAEAATMWGGAFLWTRTKHWRPSFTLVEGQQVDYTWLDEAEDFSMKQLLAFQKKRQTEKKINRNN